ncbi:MAG: DUF6796 family protein [Bacteroidota bacterium]
MTTNTKVSLALLAAIAGALTLVIGDVLILGYETLSERYPLFAQDYAYQLDANAASQLVNAPTENLLVGTLCVALCVPLLLPGIWLVYQTLRDKKQWYANVVFFSLMAGAALTPLLHSKMLFLGETYKALLHTDPSAHPQLLAMAQNFRTVMYVGWSVALLFLTVGWVAYAICIFRGKTYLPRWAGLTSPHLLSTC